MMNLKGQRHKVEHGSIEWHGDRLGRLTASEIYKIIKPGKAGQPFTDGGLTYLRRKANEVLVGAMLEEREFEQTKWGKDNEPIALQLFEGIVTGYAYEHEYLFGTPDGEDDTAIYEVKCPFNQGKHFENWMIKSVEELKQKRPEYYWQVVANMCLSGKNHGRLISFDPRLEGEFKYKIFEIPLVEEDELLLYVRVKLATKKIDQLIYELTIQN